MTGPDPTRTLNSIQLVSPCQTDLIRLVCSLIYADFAIHNRVSSRHSWVRELDFSRHRGQDYASRWVRVRPLAGALDSFKDAAYAAPMTLSARNRLVGKVVEIQF